MTYNVLDVSLYIINYSNQKNYSVSKEVTYDDKVIEDRDKALIKGVVDTFDDYSASEIMRLSHKQDPWKNVFRAGENNEITLNSLKEYFR